MAQAAGKAEALELLRDGLVGSNVLFDDFQLPPLRDPSFEVCAFEENDPVSATSAELTHRPPRKASRHNFRGWTPPFLTRKCLAGFIGLWAVLFILLAVLFGYSQNHTGLSNADEHLYYIWTYGPTAVLSITSALWGQVVYRTKQLMPWKAMTSGPQPAAKSVLLDYVSPMGPVALQKALVNSHLTVSLSVISSFIMLALTVTSTGLFSLQYVEITTDNVMLRTSNHFEFEYFDWTSVDSRPAGLAYATAVLGLQYPPGTTSQFAVQDFSVPSGSNQTCIAVADVFSTRLECELADLALTNVSAYSPIGPLFHSGATFTTNLTTSNCTVVDFQINTPTMLDQNTPWNGTNIEPWGYGQLGSCVESSELRVLVSTGTYIVHEQWNGTESDNNIGLSLPYNQMFQIINSTNMLCKPGYTIERARVVKSSNSTSSSQFQNIDPVGPTELQINTDRAADIARSVFQSVDDPNTRPYYMNGTTMSYDTFFSIMRSKGVDPNDFNDLLNKSNALYKSIAAQIASLKLLVPQDNTIHGQIIKNTPRLFVRVLSFSIMEAGFAILVCISAYLLFSASEPVVSHDPGSVDGFAAILSKSPGLIILSNGKECQEKSDFDTSWQDCAYYTQHSGRVSRTDCTRILLEKREVAGKLPNAVQKHETPKKFWEPLILRMPIRILVILVSLIYIVVLEVLLVVSQSHHGIVSIAIDSWLHYGWTYLPALSMVTIGVAYRSANTSIKIISPYAAMKESSVPASISVQDHLLSRTTLHELFISAKQRQIAVFLTSIATVLASLLTIAVSGLYNPVSHSQAVGIRQFTAWNFNQAERPNMTLLNETFVSLNQSYPGLVDLEGSLNLVTALTVTTNLSYPAWSYDELALPLLELRSLSSDSTTGSQTLIGFVNVTIPAVRGTLNCSVVPHDFVDITYHANDSSGQVSNGNSQCLNYTWTGTESMSYPDENCRNAIFSIRDGLSLGGCSLASLSMFLPRHGLNNQTFGFFDTASFMNYSYCPSYVGMIGTTTTDSIVDYTWFACSTQAERVDVFSTFALPDYKVLTASANESTAERLAGNDTFILYNSTGSANWVPCTGPNSALYNGGNPVRPNSYLTFYNNTDGQNFDNFFSSLVYGRDGVSADTMLGESNTDRLLAAVQHLWRVVVAQQLRTNIAWMSAESDDLRAWAPAGLWNGTLYDSGAYRLKQSIVSTRILQGVLAAMAFCGVFAFIALGSTNKLLPKNPSSIAVVASLLAGSEYLREIQRMDRVSDDKRRDKGSDTARWKGYLFSLGWWDREDGGRRFGIDIGRADAAR